MTGLNFEKLILSMPDPFEITAGENLLIEVPLYKLLSGYTWKGRYDNATPYVVDDALLGDDNIGYHVIAPTTGNPPPDPTYYEELEPVPAESIASVILQLVQSGKTVVQWVYRGRAAKLTAGSLTIGKQYLIYDYNGSDDFTNVGAASNAQGVIFTATGPTPTEWSGESILYEVNMPSNFELEEGLFRAELLATDTIPLSGTFELRIAIASDDAMYIATGAQTDVLCIENALTINPC